MIVSNALIEVPASARVASVTYDDASMIITRTLEYEDHTSTSIYADVPSTRVEVETWPHMRAFIARLAASTSSA